MNDNTVKQTPVRVLECEEIIKIIPHRYPFLLVDKVEIMEENKFGIGTKCVTVNELYFQGHFPHKPVMPGVLILEAMAQTAAAMMMSLPENKGKIAYIAGINKAKFRRQVIPGDVLKMHIEIIRFKGKIGRLKGQTYVDGQPAAEAEYVAAVE